MSLKHRGLLIILDGLGDRPADILGGMTPLAAARTPNLDRLLERGSGGCVDPLAPGVPVDTHTGAGILLGLTPNSALDLPRGPVEAAGSGSALDPSDVAVRVNLATVRRENGSLWVVDRRAGRIREGTADLARSLVDVPLGAGILGTLVPATQHRAVLHLRGEGLSAAISDTDPGTGEIPALIRTCQPVGDDGVNDAQRTADAVNDFVDKAFQILGDHPVNRERISRGLLPANGVVTRGAGSVGHYPNVMNHLGLKTAVVSGERSLLGLGQLFGFTTKTDPRFTTLPDTDLLAKVAATQAAGEDHDLVILHVKGTDICSHDLDPVGKKEFIERADSALAPLLAEDRAIAVGADHSTDSTIGCHCGDPVPAILCAPRGRIDALDRFDETNCAHGGLGRVSGHAFLMSLLNAMGAVSNYRPSDRGFLGG